MRTSRSWSPLLAICGLVSILAGAIVPARDARASSAPRPAVAGPRTFAGFRLPAHARPAARAGTTAADRGASEARTEANRWVPDAAGGYYVVWDEYRYADFSGVYVQHFTPGGAPDAAWPAYGLSPTSMPTAAFMSRLVSDNAGGVIVLWSDTRGNRPAVYAQRLDDSGNRLWSGAGVRLDTGTGDQLLDSAIPDGDGGCIAVWLDYRNDPTLFEADIYAQRITATGAVAPGWAAGGTPVCAASGDQFGTIAVPDSSRGVIVNWIDGRGSGFAYAQRVDALGRLRWTLDGEPLPPELDGYGMVSDGAGGAIFTWYGISTVNFSLDILAQRIDGSANLLWGPGVTVCGDPGSQLYPDIVADGAGGAIISWTDFRGGDAVIYAKRIDSSGGTVSDWPADGLATSDVSGGTGPGVGLASDGAGGAYLAWLDYRSLPGRPYAQHMLGSGTLDSGWPTGGAQVSAAAAAYSIRLLGLGGGGEIVVTWGDFRSTSPGPGLYAQRLDAANGSPLWKTDGLPFSLDGLSQRRPVAVSDSAGGTIVFWSELRNTNWLIRAKRVDSSGNPVGSTTTVCDAAGYRANLVAVPDGIGGAIAAWVDDRGSTSNVYVQRLNAAVVPQWTANGVLIGISRMSFYNNPSLVSSGAGGAIVAWENLGSGIDIMAQRLDSGGNLLWPGGVSLSGPASVSNPHVTTDGANGVIALWQNDAGGLLGPRLVAGRVSSSGTNLWSASGVPVCSDTVGQLTPSIIADGAGGAYVSWADLRKGTTADYDIYAQHFDEFGNYVTGWPGAGLPVCTSANDQLWPFMSRAAANGVYVAWWDARGSTWANYAQRINSAGVVQWTPNGLPIPGGAAEQRLEDLLSDGAGGAIAVWADARGSNWDVYAQRISDSGSALWNSTGLLVTGATEAQGDARLVTDRANGAVAAWQDSRALPNDQIFVQRLTAGGSAVWTGDGVTSTLASLLSADVSPGRARLVWEVSDAEYAGTLYRREEGGAWGPVANVSADGSGRVAFEDRGVIAGRRYGYRLGAWEGGVERFVGEAWITVPAALELAIEGARPNPATGDFAVSFTLPRDERATLEMIDLAGRRVLVRDVGGLGAGRHVVRLDEASALPAGLYWLRLTQDGRSLSKRISLVR